MEGLGGRPLTPSWRLLVTPPAPGAWNMALDDALNESVRAGGRPFLRFYQWEPTLSLGRFQNPTTGLAPAAASVPRVRRPTGGGAIWHADELTYSLGCHQDDLGITGVKASFELLCSFLLETWRGLGWEAHYAKDAPAGADVALGAFTPACFAGQEEYDILVSGRKLGGNAQRRERTVIFQHGSIPRRLDHPTLGSLFLPGFEPDPGATTDLATCGWSRSATDLIPLLAESFARRVGAWEASEVTQAEAHRAAVLVQERYGDPKWTETGGGTLRAGSESK